MSKKAADTSKAKAPPPPPLAQELHVDTDLRRLADALSQMGDIAAPLVKRLKVELSRVKEGEQEGVPLIPLFIPAVIPYAQVRYMTSQALPPYPYIRKIQLHHSAIGDDGVLLLAEFIKGYKPLPDRNPFGVQVLELPGCQITARGATYLAKLLAENSTIESLSLDFNPLGDSGARNLCDALRWNSSLHTLSLQYCQIEGLGGAALASCAIKGSNVATLLLKGNCLGASGVCALGTALCTGNQIQELDLADTGFGASADAIETLCEGLETNQSLTSLNLDLNTLLSSGPQSIVTALRKSDRIVSLVLSERTNPEVYGEILDILAANRKLAKSKKKTKK